MSQITKMPLFPLNLVLFPKQLLRLHIFEPRYREMINECVADKRPFGVVLIQEGTRPRVGDAIATPFKIGTTARIREVKRLPDGRMNILCAGEARFKLNALNHDRSFLIGDTELWPWESLAADEAEPRLSQLGNLLIAYLKRLTLAMEKSIHVSNLPANGTTLATLCAIALQIPKHEKQHLLASTTTGDLIDGCIDLFRREIRAFRVVSAVPTILDEAVLTFSNN